MSWKITPTLTWNETVWNPSMIQTTLWLDAADASTITLASGAVSQWNDKSGQGYNVAQSTPAERPLISTSYQNSLNAVLFDGSNDFLETSKNFPIIGNPAFSVFTALKTITGAVALGWGINNPLEGAGLFGPGFAYMGGNTFTFATPPNANTSSLVGYIKSTGPIDTSSAAYINGSLNQASSGQPTGVPIIANRPLRVGRLNEFASFHNGYIYELIVLGYAASATMRQRIEGYLAHKWGLTTNLPSDHPYKTVGPTP